uniref:Uncharacterized protein LOC107261446 n=1 Tax=Rhizophora mucronata TaxID=61149 RepID=A0A2P2IU13_RHIMU
MITRSKLAEQLKLIEQLGGDQRIRSQYMCSPLLIIFSPKPCITSWYLSVM